MKKMFTILLCVLFAMALITSASFGAKKKYVIGKIPITLENNFHQTLVKYEKDYAMSKYGAEVRVIDGQFTVEAQLKAVESFINQKVDAICLHAFDPSMMVTAVAKAHKAGIPISTMYIYPGVKANPHLQQWEPKASFDMGVVAAKKWKEWYPNKPIYVGEIDALNIETVWLMRTGPFWEGVKSIDPKAKLVSRLDGLPGSESAMKVTFDMLQAHPEINIIYGAWADLALGAYAACEQLGRGKAVNGKCLTEIVVGTDGTDAEILKIYDPSSSYKITMGMSPKTNAYAEIDLAMQMIEKKIPWNKWLEVKTYNKEIDYWFTPMADAQKWLTEDFFSKTDIKAELAK